MGTDIHSYLEKKIDGAWVPYFEPTLECDWYESLVYTKALGEEGDILCPTMSKNEKIEYFKDHFKNIDIKEATEKYIDHSDIYLRWAEHYYDLGIDHTSRYTKQSPIRSRDYSWFAMIASIRGDGMEPKGLPDNISKRVINEYNKTVGDNHSASWLFVHEILIQKTEQALWLKNKNIDPEARLVFWFDN